jgi:hypothetical protein
MSQSISVRIAALPRERLLRLALQVDAVVTGANGIAYLALAGPLGDLFEVPAGFLRGIGVFLALFAVAVWLIALRPKPLAAGVVAANVAWVLASVSFVLFDVHEPSAAGVVWTLMQAVTVAGFAGLQALGLRRG